TRELDGEVPGHLRDWWAQDQPWIFHSAAWWRRHWGRTGILDVEVADTLPDGWQLWRDWLKIIAPNNTTEIRAIETDAGGLLGYLRVGGRGGSAALPEPVASIPAEYVKKPLLRGSP